MSITKTETNHNFVKSFINPVPENWRELGYSKLLVVDTETTGLDKSNDEIIELGLMSLAYNPKDFRIAGYIDKYNGLQQPSKAISPKITQITGITNEAVAGQSIDWINVQLIASGADLVIAHNASFDRPFLDRYTDAFDGMPWGCSCTDVPWKKLGFMSAKLKSISLEMGMIYGAHRALNDVEQTAVILNETLSDGMAALQYVVSSTSKPSYSIYTVGWPYSRNHELKERELQYRFNGSVSPKTPKAWCCVTDNEALMIQEVQWLRSQGCHPVVNSQSAEERFSA